uniref:RNA-dependent RNA polymerase n=1 Tax=Guangdong catfish astro-like virus TaxID=2116333 RepID=A0A2P1GMB6_9VIRU|nr:RNA-dependent RNA polymerase [Guangdong catfish astro-like virus]
MHLSQLVWILKGLLLLGGPNIKNDDCKGFGHKFNMTHVELAVLGTCLGTSSVGLFQLEVPCTLTLPILQLAKDGYMDPWVRCSSKPEPTCKLECPKPPPCPECKEVPKVCPNQTQNRVFRNPIAKTQQETAGSGLEKLLGPTIVVAAGYLRYNGVLGLEEKENYTDTVIPMIVALLVLKKQYKLAFAIMILYTISGVDGAKTRKKVPAPPAPIVQPATGTTDPTPDPEHQIDIILSTGISTMIAYIKFNFNWTGLAWLLACIVPFALPKKWVSPGSFVLVLSVVLDYAIAEIHWLDIVQLTLCCMILLCRGHNLLRAGMFITSMALWVADWPLTPWRNTITLLVKFKLVIVATFHSKALAIVTAASALFEVARGQPVLTTTQKALNFPIILLARSKLIFFLLIFMSLIPGAEGFAIWDYTIEPIITAFNYSYDLAVGSFQWTLGWLFWCCYHKVMEILYACAIRGTLYGMEFLFLVSLLSLIIFAFRGRLKTSNDVACGFCLVMAYATVGYWFAHSMVLFFALLNYLSASSGMLPKFTSLMNGYFILYVLPVTAWITQNALLPVWMHNVPIPSNLALFVIMSTVALEFFPIFCKAMIVVYKDPVSGKTIKTERKCGPFTMFLLGDLGVDWSCAKGIPVAKTGDVLQRSGPPGIDTMRKLAILHQNKEVVKKTENPDQIVSDMRGLGWVESEGQYIGNCALIKVGDYTCILTSVHVAYDASGLRPNIKFYFPSIGYVDACPFKAAPNADLALFSIEKKVPYALKISTNTNTKMLLHTGFSDKNKVFSQFILRPVGGVAPNRQVYPGMSGSVLINPDTGLVVAILWAKLDCTAAAFVGLNPFALMTSQEFDSVAVSIIELKAKKNEAQLELTHAREKLRMEIQAKAPQLLQIETQLKQIEAQIAEEEDPLLVLEHKLYCQLVRETADEINKKGYLNVLKGNKQKLLEQRKKLRATDTVLLSQLRKQLKALDMDLNQELTKVKEAAIPQEDVVDAATPLPADEAASAEVRMPNAPLVVIWPIVWRDADKWNVAWNATDKPEVYDTHPELENVVIQKMCSLYGKNTRMARKMLHNAIYDKEWALSLLEQEASTPVAHPIVAFLRKWGVLDAQAQCDYCGMIFECPEHHTHDLKCKKEQLQNCERHADWCGNNTIRDGEVTIDGITYAYRDGRIAITPNIICLRGGPEHKCAFEAKPNMKFNQHYRVYHPSYTRYYVEKRCLEDLYRRIKEIEIPTDAADALENLLKRQNAIKNRAVEATLEIVTEMAKNVEFYKDDAFEQRASSDDMHASVENLNQELIVLSTDNHTLRSMLEEHIAARNELQIQLEAATAEKQEMAMMLLDEMPENNYQSLIQEQDEKIIELKGVIANMQAEKETGQTSTDESEIIFLRQQMADLEAQAAKSRQQNQEVINALMLEGTNLKKELNAAKQDNIELAEQKEACEKIKKQNLEKYATEREALNKKINTLTNQLARTSEKLEDLKLKKLVLEHEVGSLQEKNVIAECERNRHLEESRRLEALLEQKTTPVSKPEPSPRKAAPTAIPKKEPLTSPTIVVTPTESETPEPAEPQRDQSNSPNSQRRLLPTYSEVVNRHDRSEFDKKGLVKGEKLKPINMELLANSKTDGNDVQHIFRPKTGAQEVHPLFMKTENHDKAIKGKCNCHLCRCKNGPCQCPSLMCVWCNSTTHMTKQCTNLAAAKCTGCSKSLLYIGNKCKCMHKQEVKCIICGSNHHAFVCPLRNMHFPTSYNKKVHLGEGWDQVFDYPKKLLSPRACPWVSQVRENFTSRSKNGELKFSFTGGLFSRAVLSKILMSTNLKLIACNTPQTLRDKIMFERACQEYDLQMAACSDDTVTYDPSDLENGTGVFNAHCTCGDCTTSFIVRTTQLVSKIPEWKMLKDLSITIPLVMQEEFAMQEMCNGPGPGFEFLEHTEIDPPEIFNEATPSEIIAGANGHWLKNHPTRTCISKALPPHKGLSNVGWVPQRTVKPIYNFEPKQSQRVPSVDALIFKEQSELFVPSTPCLKMEWENIDKYSVKHRPIDIHPGIMVQAVEMMLESLNMKPGQFELATPAEVRVEKSWNTSPGYPYNINSKTSLEAAELEHRRINRSASQMASGWAPTIWNIIGKDEILPAKKAAEKVRTILGPSMCHQMVAQKLTLKICKHQNDQSAHSESQLGSSKYHGHYNQLFQRFNGAVYVEYDASGWDRNVHPTLLKILHMVFWTLLKTTNQSNYYELANVFESMIYSFLVYKNGQLVRKWTGLPSGCTLTANANTMIHMIIQNTSSIITGSPHAYICYGDDGIMTSDHPEAPVIAKTYFAAFGMNLDKQFKSQNQKTGLTWLGTTVHQLENGNFVPLGNLEKAKASIYWSGGSKIGGKNESYELAVAWSLLAENAWHEFNKLQPIIDFIRKVAQKVVQRKSGNKFKIQEVGEIDTSTIAEIVVNSADSALLLQVRSIFYGL